METNALTITSASGFEIAPDLITQPDSSLTITQDSAKIYYRSRLFSANSGPNPLVTVAQPLLVLLSRLINSQQLKEQQLLYQTIPHELQAFAVRAKDYGYNIAAINLAHYLLATALDDVLQLKQAAVEPIVDNDSKKLQTNSCNESFFVILNKLQQYPANHCDILELSYIIISLGYAGNYRYAPGGKHELENILENTYQIIRHQRGDDLASLLVKEQEKINQSVSNSNSISTFWLTVLVISIVASFAVGFNYVLNSVIQTQTTELHQNNDNK